VSILEQEMTLIGSLGRVKCVAMFDSGASYSIVRRDIAEQIARLEFRFADSKARFSDEFVVFDTLTEAVIIGAKTMQAWRITLDFNLEKVIYRKSAERLRVV